VYLFHVSVICWIVFASKFYRPVVLGYGLTELLTSAIGHYRRLILKLAQLSTFVVDSIFRVRQCKLNRWNAFNMPKGWTPKAEVTHYTCAKQTKYEIHFNNMLPNCISNADEEHKTRFPFLCNFLVYTTVLYVFLCFLCRLQ